MKRLLIITILIIFTLISSAQIPVINIDAPNGISWNDNLRLATFSMTDNEGNVVNSNIGIKYHGGSSLSYPKKSYKIEFWEDENGNVTKDVSLLGMRSDDDWFLIAGYCEPLRLRTKSCMELWRQINTIYYQNIEPEALNGVRMEYAEVYLNNDYQGIYVISEKIDRKQLKLKKFKNNVIHGELYKGTEKHNTSFDSLPPYNNDTLQWGGFEYKYPEEVIDWANLYNFCNYVINSNDDYFYQSIDSQFEMTTAVDYFIFINVLKDIDNLGKNIYIARYNDDEPYYYVPWDLDASLGINWQGLQSTITSGILSNGLYNRLLRDYRQNGFVNQVVERWHQLYGNVISTDNIMSVLQANYDYLSGNGAYEREVARWPEIAYDPTNLSYTRTWLEGRLQYLNDYFELLSVFENEIEKQNVILFPNPASDFVNIQIPEEKIIKEIKIYNLNGAEINFKTLSINDNQATMSTKNLSQGVYLINVIGDDFSVKSKLIIK